MLRKMLAIAALSILSSLIPHPSSLAQTIQCPVIRGRVATIQHFKDGTPYCVYFKANPNDNDRDSETVSRRSREQFRRIQRQSGRRSAQSSRSGGGR